MIRLISYSKRTFSAATRRGQPYSLPTHDFYRPADYSKLPEILNKSPLILIRHAESEANVTLRQLRERQAENPDQPYTLG